MTRGTRLGGAVLLAVLVTMTNARAAHLEWGSFLGGPWEDEAGAIALDGSGNVLVAGKTNSAGWVSGGWDLTLSGHDVFIVKLTGSGAHVWSSYLGDTLDEGIGDITVDAAGNVHIVGYREDDPYPPDAFATKVGPDGTHLWTVDLEGDATVMAHGVAVDADGNVLVTGETGSVGWVSGGYSTIYGGGDRDGFLVKLNASGGHVWSTYLPGGNNDYGRDVVVRSNGDILAVGDTRSADASTYSDVFFLRLTAAGAYVGASFLGGTGHDYATGAALDGSDNLFVSGYTASSGWVSGGWDTSYGGGTTDGFAAKISPAGTMVWSTYLGGTDKDQALDIALDGAGNVCVVGWTESANWVGGAWNAVHNGGDADGSDGFAAKLSPDGAHVWSTYTGASSSDEAQGVAADAMGNVFVAGKTESGGWLYGGWDTEFDRYTDGFVLRISGWLGTAGALQVTLDPPQASLAGARWRLTTEDVWHESGETLTGLAAGPWGIVFGDATGYITPPTQFVTVPEGGTCTAEAVYNRPVTFAGTYVGGSSRDTIRGVAADDAGNLYVTGDDFISKFGPDLDRLWTFPIQGDGEGIALDAEGNVYAAGTTTTSGWVSGGYNTVREGSDAFLVKLTPDGTHLWSTYAGYSSDTDYDGGHAVAVDTAGNAIVVGTSRSPYWDITIKYRDAFKYWKISPEGQLLSTGDTYRLNGTRVGSVTADPYGNFYYSGDLNGGEIVRNPDTNQWPVYFGFQDNPFPPMLASDGEGNVVAAKAHNGDVLVGKFSASGTQVFSASFGGSNTETVYGVTCDENGDIYVTGGTSSDGWVAGGPDVVRDGGDDAYLVKMSASGQVLWSTYLGREGSDVGRCVAVGPGGTIHVVGETSSAGWLEDGWDTSYNGGGDGFIARVEKRDMDPPWGAVVINGNRSSTNSAEVTLSLTWDDGLGSGVSSMRFSNNGSTWSPWEPVAATRAWTLRPGDGYRTVRVQYRDRAGNYSDRFSDYIRVDATPPTGTIVINDDRSATTSPEVTLSLTWDDAGGSGVTRMRFSSNGYTWSPWEPLSATRAYTLPPVPGHHTVRVTYRDAAGNVSDRFSDYIRLDSP